MKYIFSYGVEGGVEEGWCWMTPRPLDDRGGPQKYRGVPVIVREGGGPGW